MPQEMQILRCYSCEIFQVHIVKKSAKWECKICGEKQSIKKVYGKGSGKDCRLHVQQLNQKCLEIDAQTPLVNEVGIENTIHLENVTDCSTLTSTDIESNQGEQFKPVATYSTDSETHGASDNGYERPCKRRKCIQNQDCIITDNASNNVATKAGTNFVNISRLCQEPNHNEKNVEHLLDVLPTTSKSKWDEFIISTLNDLTTEDCKLLDDHNTCETSPTCIDVSKNLHCSETNANLNVRNMNYVPDQSAVEMNNRYQGQTLFPTCSQINPSEWNTENQLKSEERLQLFNVGENDLDAIFSF